MDELNLKGEKGGGGGSNSFTQTPDNLRSDDTFEGVLGLAIGPLKGPVRGLKGIKINGTQVENETGERNYGDVVINWADGDPTKFPQMVELKLGSGAAPLQINQQLPNNATSGNPWVTRTLNNTGADFLDLRFVVNQLFRQDEKGIYTEDLTIQVQLKPVGKTQWIDPTFLERPAGETYRDPTQDLMTSILVTAITDNYTPQNLPGFSGFRINGKTSSPSVHELRLDVPNTGPYANVAWDVRCRLTEPDTVDTNNGKNMERRNVQWESLAGVYSSKMGDHEDWRGVAWMQVYGKASTQLTGVPEMTGEWDTKLINVPPASVFNPETRQYTSTIWDGSWAKSYTNDPAWVVNDAISDSLSGLSLIAQGSYLNKWDALECSKWCSVLVPDGAGGMHPRYSLNLAINEPAKAEDFIRYLAGAVGGLAWDQGDGEWRLRIDKPETPVDIFSLETIEGEFSYSHTDVDTRYNDITMVFKNAEMDYREDRVRLYKNEHIAQFGRKPTTVVAVGCTHRQEAMRRGKLRLESTTGETRIVNFSTNRRGRNVQQLDMILVADGDLGDIENRSTGRTIAVSPDRMTITLRDPVRLEIGVDYELNFASPNPNYNPETPAQPGNPTWKLPTIVQTRAITNNNSTANRGNVTTLTLDAPLPEDIPDNLSISLSAVGLPTLPKLYRVLNVVKDDSGERIGISAVEVNTDKWDAADNVSHEDTVFQDLRGAPAMPRPPTSGEMLSLLSMTTPNGVVITTIAGRFERPPGGFISGFRIEYRFNNSNRILLTERQTQTTFEIPSPMMGLYTVEVRTVDRLGKVSLPLIGEIEVTEEQAGGIPGAGGNYTHVAYADSIDGLQNFTTGAPNGRGYRGEYSDNLVEDSPSPSDYEWSQYSGPAAFGLGLHGSPSAGFLRGNLVERTSGSGFNFGAFSTEGWLSGAACAFRVKGGEVYAGLNSDPSSSGDANSIDYAFYVKAGGQIEIRMSGILQPVSGLGTWDDSTLFQIVYDNISVRWFINGVLKHTVGTTGSQSFWFDSSIALVGSNLNNIAWTSAGARGIDGAGTGVPGEPGEDGQTSYVHIAYADSLDGTQNFTIGAPAGRGYRGEYVDFNPVDSSNPAAYTWSQYLGPGAFGLALHGLVDAGYLRGNMVERTSGSGFNFGVYSTEGWQSGAAASFRVGGPGEVFAGLNSDPSSSGDANSLDYAFYVKSGGQLEIRISGIVQPVTGLPTWNANTTFQIVYDSATVRWFVNGALVHSVGTSANLMFWFDSSIGTAGANLNSIGWAAAGARGLDGAATGVPGEPGEDGKTSYVHIAYADSADGTQNFTVGAPQGRGYRGEYVDFNAADSTNPAAYEWSQYLGPSAFGLALHGATTSGYLRGNMLVKTGGGAGWDFGAFSTEGFRGGAATSFKVVNGGVMAGLNVDPSSNANYTSIDYAFYATTGGAVQVYVNGGHIAGVGTWNTNTVFQIVYDNQFVRWLLNGVVVYTLEIGANLLLYFDSSIADIGSNINSIGFAIAGARGVDGDDGAPGEPGENGLTPYFHTAFADSADGTINFTTGAPNGRGYRGEYVDYTPADSTNPAAYTWSKYTGPATFGLIAHTASGAGVQGFIRENSVHKLSTGSGAWNFGAYSSEGFRSGAQTTFRGRRSPGGLGAFGVGLNSDPTTNADWTSIDYQWQLADNGGGCSVYEGSTFQGIGGGPWNESTVFQVIYDNDTVRWIKDGVVIYSKKVAANLLLYFDSSILYPDTAVTDITFTPSGAAGATPITFELSSQAMTIAATNTGVTKSGQLPKTSTVLVRQGPTIITDGIGGSITTSSSAISGDFTFEVINGNNTRVFRLLTADASGWVDIEIHVNGVTLGKKRIAITRVTDPTAPGSVKSANKTFNGAGVPNSTTYQTVPGTGTVIMTVGPSGVLYFNMNYTFTTSGGGTTQQHIKAKAVYRQAGTGASYSDFGTGEVSTGPASANSAEPLIGEGGLVRQISGLSPDMQYEIGVVFARADGSPGSNVFNTVTGIFETGAT